MLPTNDYALASLTHPTIVAHVAHGTRWDLSDIDIGPDDDELGLHFALDELRALRDLDPALRGVLPGSLGPSCSRWWMAS